MWLKIVCSLLSAITFVHGDAPSWHYYGDDGPSTWHTGYPQCGLGHQSPINIVTDDVMYDGDMGDIMFTGFETPPATATLFLENNGHAAEIVVTGEELQISGGSLPYTYQLDEYHFHWGADSTVGSEHAVDGSHYPLEMHMVHFSTAYDTIALADDGDDHSIAVLAFLFEVQDEDNPALAEMITHISNVPNMGDEVELENFAIGPLLPADISIYYRYAGSFTTPPCYESVVWTVFKETIKISETQLATFRLMFFNPPEGDPVQLVNNFRPVQDIHNRTVMSNDPAFDDGGGSGPGDGSHGNVLRISVVTLVATLVVMHL